LYLTSTAKQGKSAKLSEKYPRENRRKQRIGEYRRNVEEEMKELRDEADEMVGEEGNQSNKDWLDEECPKRMSKKNCAEKSDAMEVKERKLRKISRRRKENRIYGKMKSGRIRKGIEEVNKYKNENVIRTQIT
jgi:hypothetical protein